MHDEIEAVGVEEFVESGAVANVYGEVREILCRRLEAVEIPESVAEGAEKFAAHVVVNADDGMALAVNVFDGFGPNEAAAAGDQDFPRLHLKEPLLTWMGWSFDMDRLCSRLGEFAPMPLLIGIDGSKQRARGT
jgi:hypothetical protein